MIPGGIFQLIANRLEDEFIANFSPSEHLIKSSNEVKRLNKARIYFNRWRLNTKVIRKQKAHWKTYYETVLDLLKLRIRDRDCNLRSTLTKN